MKTKETTDSKFLNLAKTLAPKAKAKSLRPMRSMMAVRSLKPKTTVAVMNLKPENEMRE